MKGVPGTYPPPGLGAVRVFGGARNPHKSDHDGTRAPVPIVVAVDVPGRGWGRPGV